MYLVSCLSAISPANMKHIFDWLVGSMVINATVNSISVISLQSDLLVEESRVLGETTDLSKVSDTLYHILLYRVHLTMSRVRTHNISGERHRLHR